MNFYSQEKGHVIIERKSTKHVNCFTCKSKCTYKCSETLEKRKM